MEWINSGSTGPAIWFSVAIDANNAVAYTGLGDSIWYSSNTGVDWTKSDLSFDFSGSNGGVSVSTFSPTEVNVVLGLNGIWYSSNGGVDWTKSNFQNVCSGVSVSGRKAVACGGDIDGLWYSSDAGATWLRATISDTTSGIWSSVSISGSVAVGCKNGLWYSNDSGEHWSQFADNDVANKNWSSISISGSNVVACSRTGVNGNGEIWYTTLTTPIGDSNWQSNAPLKDWDGISISGNNAVAYESTGVLWYSSNAGATWQSSSNPPYAACASISNSNVVVGTYDGLWYSSNSITTYTKTQVQPPIVNACDAISIDGSNAVAGGRGEIFYSSNKGVNWHQSNEPFSTNLWFSVSISGDNAVICSLQSYSLGTIKYSNDKGVNWHQSDAENREWSSVSISGSVAVVCDNGGGLWYSNDAGEHWSQFAVANKNWSSISISGSNVVACETGVNGNGEIWYTTLTTSIGDSNWQTSNAPLKKWVGISISGNNAVAYETTSDTGVLWYSTDAGETWNKSQEIDKPVKGTVSISGDNAITTASISGDSFFINYSNDGGKTWKPSQAGYFLSTAVSGNNAVAGAYLGNLWYASFPAPCLLSTCSILMGDRTFKPVTEVRNGDEVLSIQTGNGVKVIHSGYMVVNYASIPNTNLPLVFPKDLLGNGVPVKDVYISGHHRVVLPAYGNSVAIQAYKFGDFKVLSEEEVLKLSGLEEVRYYHIEVEGGKDFINCDGLPVETLDAGEWSSSHIEN
jgi:photosystem II stability/assembly factor-like uncharacterized protein